MQKKTADPELPAEVVYYNQWTDFENKEMRALFRCVPFARLAKFAPGSLLWIDSEKPSGKVYGFIRATLVSVSQTERHVGLMIKGPNIEGGISVEKRTGWHKVHECTDPRKLARLVKEFPLSTETGTVSTISEASREYLRKQGKVVVGRTP